MYDRIDNEDFYAEVARRVHCPSDEEIKLRSQVRFLPQANIDRVKHQYVSFIESFRLRDNKEVSRVLPNSPPWLTDAVGCALAMGWNYVGYEGIHTVCRHLGLPQDFAATKVLEALYEQPIFLQAVEQGYAVNHAIYEMTGKELDEADLASIKLRAENEKKPSDFIALMNLYDKRKLSYFKRWKII